MDATHIPDKQKSQEIPSVRRNQVVSIQIANNQSRSLTRSNNNTAENTSSEIDSTTRSTSLTNNSASQIRSRVLCSTKILPDFEIRQQFSLHMTDLDLRFGKTESV